ncbi:type II toxin-antitoxin system prevent-host-death family antitoxin [Candidatus Fermentibacteria bacterium]|nr:type II toxin-antitoxin system prevent-host-death family antitoxin [Candidatus Fermentibacteria bacterium]
MHTAIGVRELKNKLSWVLGRVRTGETITVTHRDKKIAVIMPAAPDQSDAVLRELVRTRMLSWSGGRPKGCDNPPKVRGRSVADAVVEDRG